MYPKIYRNGLIWELVSVLSAAFPTKAALVLIVEKLFLIRGLVGLICVK